MFRMPKAEQQLYEAAIYNRTVREMVKSNRSHPLFDDKWADVHIFEVSASSEDEARSILARRYSPDLGFIVEVVIPARLSAAA
jgi:hypothetical protein